LSSAARPRWQITLSIKEVDREQLAEGEHVELVIGESGHHIYVTAVEGQTVCVIGNGRGEQASISLTDEDWRLNVPETID
jgi:hypothetical protein